MTVRETLDFSGRCLGVGTRYDLLVELSTREKAAGIKPDSEIDAIMKATAMEGQETSLINDYVLKDWNSMDWSEGCVRSSPLSCHDQGKDGFLKFSGWKLLDAQHTWVNKSMNLQEYRDKCLRNCSCMA
ncbi:pleiotropic drug resistance protein 2-like [Humulus lupulus]|uniref:pleiotropic drug resistance protein 2-like n=1 Tax=Humulus lupulus TaxID=3486 RepID=UPI002B40F53C|nr:pleiotropic drug resistance protein 2-like [Humulus lupulus]